jgi:hypothetical protein
MRTLCTITSFSDPDPDWIRIQFGPWIWTQTEQLTHKKIEKSEEISWLNMLYVLFWRAEGFSFSLRALKEALIKILNFFIKIFEFFSQL